MYREELDLRQKTFKADSEEEIDKLANTFSEEKSVRFTQTNQVAINNKIVFVTTLFYEKDEFITAAGENIKVEPVGKEKEETQKKEEKHRALKENEMPCPKCGEPINKKFLFHGCGWKKEINK